MKIYLIIREICTVAHSGVKIISKSDIYTGEYHFSAIVRSRADLKNHLKIINLSLIKKTLYLYDDGEKSIEIIL